MDARGTSPIFHEPFTMLSSSNLAHLLAALRQALLMRQTVLYTYMSSIRSPRMLLYKPRILRYVLPRI